MIAINRIFFNPVRNVPRRTVVITLVAALGSAVLFYLYLRHRTRTFPSLPTGAYVGQLSGVGETPDNFHSIYVERVTGANAMLFVIFADGWTPQVVSLDPDKGKSLESPLKKVKLHRGDDSYTLFGAQSSEGYSGEVTDKLGVTGAWFIKPVSSASLRAAVPPELASFDLVRWLRIKAKHARLESETQALRSTNEEQQTKYVRLEQFVKDEDSLRERSRTKRNELAEELNQITAERQRSSDQLKAALNNLDTMARIKEQGKAIDVARRIADRENRWYLAKWSGETGDNSGATAEIAQKEQIDLEKLDVEYRHALEIQQLKKSIIDERAEIQRLESAIDERQHPAPSPSPGVPAATEEPRKPWWKRWDF